MYNRPRDGSIFKGGITVQIKYIISASVFNKKTQKAVIVSKEYENTIRVVEHALYDNDHLIVTDHIYGLLGDSLSVFLLNNELTEADIVIQTYEIESLTDGVDMYLANLEQPEIYTMSPSVIAFVPKPTVTIPTPMGLDANLIEPTTIKWTWNTIEGQYAHHVVDIDGNIIATLSITVNEFIESGLQYNKNYTRRIIRFNKEGQSLSSNPVTITTGEMIQKELSYKPFLIDPKDIVRHETRIFRPIEERLEAFQSGIGSGIDLLVQKQASDEFFEEFKLISILQADRRFIDGVYPPVPITLKYQGTGEIPVKHYTGFVDIAIAVSKLYEMSLKVHSEVYEPINIKWRVCVDVQYQEVNPDVLAYYEAMSEKLNNKR